MSLPSDSHTQQNKGQKSSHTQNIYDWPPLLPPDYGQAPAWEGEKEGVLKKVKAEAELSQHHFLTINNIDTLLGRTDHSASLQVKDVGLFIIDTQ